MEWVTCAENNRHKCVILQRQSRGMSRYNAKLSDKKVLAIKELCKRGHKQRRIAERFNVSENIISNIKNNKRWKHMK